MTWTPAVEIFRMRSIVPILVLAVPLTAAVASAQRPDHPTPVERVDLERYAGLWYEMARVPNRFQRQCTGPVTAEYRLRDDGRIDVVNRCVRRDGSVDTAEGVARVVDGSSNARLEVSFVSFLGWRPFWGDYWILGLGEGYEWAVVGVPDREYGWILSREPELDPGERASIERVLRRQGYDPAAFEETPRP